MHHFIHLSKKTAYDMLISMQLLLLATTFWDFWITLFIHSSLRAMVFSGLGTVSTVAFITVPWAICIILLSLTFIAFLIRPEHCTIQVSTHYMYGFLCVMYSAFTILAITNPLVMWPIALSYAVNAIWAGVVLYFRILVKSIYEPADVMK